MKKESTSFCNYIFFTCINPGKIFIIKNHKLRQEIIIQRDFYDKLKNLDISFNNVSFYVCLGPGSYTGIRQTIAFFMGVRLIKKLRLYTFTFFDYFSYIFKKELRKKSKLVINGFATSLNNNYRGFGYDLKTKKYFYYNQNKVCNDCIWIENPASLIKEASVVEFLKDAEQNNVFSNKLNPLYINPVHITKSSKNA